MANTNNVLINLVPSAVRLAALSGHCLAGRTLSLSVSLSHFHSLSLSLDSLKV